MDFLEKINRYPVTVISTSRSGSTALAQLISNSHNLVYYKHPKYINFDQDNFLQFIKTNSNWILKIHADELICYYSSWLKFIKTTFLLRIRRKNIINQIASHYIATIRNEWSNTELKNNDVELIIDQTKILNSIHAIQKENLFVEKIPLKFDLDLWYEDLNLDDSGFYKTSKPNNYENIIDIINKKLLKKKND